MERVEINQNVTFSRYVQGFWRAHTWQMSDQALNRHLHELVARGITTMDHADIYGDYQCEAIFGRALKLSPELRDQIEIVTKCGIVLPSERLQQTGHRYDYSPQHIVNAVDQSLQHMGTDYIDTLLLHRPSPLMDPSDVVQAIEQLVAQGKIRAFGVSNFNASQLDLLNHTLMQHKCHVAVNQLEVSPYHISTLEDGTLDHMMTQNVNVMAWSPLGGGKLFDTTDARTRRILSIVSPLALKYHVSTTAIIMAWLQRHPARIMPVLGTQQLARVDEACAGATVSLTDQEWFDIYVAARGEAIP